MKNFIFSITVLAGLIAVTKTMRCFLDKKSLQIDIGMSNKCIEKMKNVIENQIDTSMYYLSMGAYFSKDVVNRPGLAKVFFEAASEERQLAIKLIEYLTENTKISDLFVGRLIKNLITFRNHVKNDWENSVEALNHTLNMEKSIISNIKDAIVKCEEDIPDFGSTELLTDEFLKKHNKRQKGFAAKISTISTMKTNGVLGEFLFDKQLLKEDNF